MFSIGMAVYDDFQGAWFTIQNLLAHHGQWVKEIIVVDNNPTSKEGQTLAAFCQNTSLKVKYVAYTEKTGTAAPRNKVFEVATAEYVMCIDPHLVIMPGAFEALETFIAAHPGTDDLIQGPLMYDNGIGISTHFADEWRGEMWGTWDFDTRYDTDKWFTIPAQGLGLFVAKRETWLKFNADFRGFGGEEWYIHEKYRQHGRACWCVSQLLWQHRFSRPQGVPYKLTRYDKARNYYIGLKELGIAFDRMEQHFKPLLTSEQMEGAKAGKLEADCGCGAKASPVLTIQQMADAAAANASDINEHVNTLRDLAAKCDVVVDCGTRYAESTIGLAAGGKSLYVVALNEPPQVKQLQKLKLPVLWIGGDSLTAEIPECDLLFIDTIHTAAHLSRELARLRSKVRRYIVLHDSVTFGAVGEDGGLGIIPAVTQLLTDYPEWTVVKHYHNNNGLLVLSRDQRDKKQPPPVAKLVGKFATMVALHVISNPNEVDKETYAQRVATCSVCELRNGERCGECGCSIEPKAKLAGEQCPVRKWLVASALPSIVHRSRWHFLKSVLRALWNRITKARKN